MSTPTAAANDSMKSLLQTFPSARRTLFAEYHIGGCSSCAYRDDETLADVCQRNEINIDDAIAKIHASHEADMEMLISPQELKKLRDDEKILLLDSRTREEHEAVTIPDSIFLTQELQTEIFAQKEPNRTIVLFDHTGKNALDTCAWFRGHGLKNTYTLKGGIDSYSKEVDKTIPRYKMEME